MRKIALWFLALTLVAINVWSPLYAIDANNDFVIIPEAGDTAKVEQAVTDVGAKWGSVWDAYTTKATDMKWEVGNQLASGIMTRETLLDYVVYIVRFLSQIGLVIGALMIIYAGYLYATSVFSGGNVAKGNTAIKNAIIGVIVVAFSYAIMKLLTSAFLS